MPFIAPLIGVAAAAMGLGAIGTAALQLGVALAVGFAAKKLAPKPGATKSGARVDLRVDTAAPRQVIVGKQLTGGSLVYWQLSGPENKELRMVIALADHECESLADVWVDGKQKSIDGSGYVADYNNKLRVQFFSGTAGQAADATLISTSNGKWTSADTGRYVCYVLVTAIYDEKKFPGGIPKLSFVVNGAKLYDPRSGLTVHTNNPAVVLYNVLTGISVGGVKLIGMNVPAAAINLTDFTAAANACDENVTLKAGGTVQRYNIAAIFDTNQTNRDIIEGILASMAGSLVESGGTYRMFAGVAQSSVASLTDDDVIVTEPYSYELRRPRSELTNAVFATYTHLGRQGNEVALPARTSSADEAEDGGIRLARNLDLTTITSRTQAQRVMEIERKRARRQKRVSLTLRARWFVLEPGDWITLSSSRRGFVNQTFEVAQVDVNPDLTTRVALREVDAAIDDWTASTDELDDNTVNDLNDAGPTLNVLASFALAKTTVTGGGTTQRPGLTATWTVVDDPTVVGIEIEYRKVGDTLALVRRMEVPSAGTYTWLDGVQGGVQYEARGRPICNPDRDITWTSWTAHATTTATQVVASAEIATEVPPDTITTEMLDPQARFELSLVTAIDTIQGSVAERMQELLDWSHGAASALVEAQVGVDTNATAIYTEQIQRTTAVEALASQVTVIAADLDTAEAAIVTEQTARASGDAANASDITTLTTTVNGHTSTIATHTSSINGHSARWSVTMSVDGYATGMILLDGSDSETVFGVLADKFVVAQPGVAGGTPKTIFTIGNIGGTPGIGINGNMIVDGVIAANHINVATLSAIAANLGTVTAGVVQGTKSYWNLGTGEFYIEA